MLSNTEASTTLVDIAELIIISHKMGQMNKTNKIELIPEQKLTILG